MERVFERMNLKVRSDLETEFEKGEREYNERKRLLAEKQAQELAYHQEILDDPAVKALLDPDAPYLPGYKPPQISTPETDLVLPQYQGLLIDRNNSIISKPSDKDRIKRAGWKRVAYDDPMKFMEHLEYGHTICTGIFNKEDKDPKYIGQYRHTKKLWASTYMIFIDGDYFKGVDFDEDGNDENPDGIEPFIDLDILSKYPALEYCYAISESVSSMHKSKMPLHRRFRLLFVLESCLDNATKVSRFISWVHSKIPFACPDDRSPAQPVYGNKGGKPVVASKNIISAALVDEIVAEPELVEAVYQPQPINGDGPTTVRGPAKTNLQQPLARKSKPRRDGYLFERSALGAACKDKSFAESYMTKQGCTHANSDPDGFERYERSGGNTNSPSEWIKRGDEDGIYIVGSHSGNGLQRLMDGSDRRSLPYMIKQSYRQIPKYADIDSDILDWQIEVDIIKQYPGYDQGLRPKPYSLDDGDSPINVLSQSLDKVQLMCDNNWPLDSAFITDPVFLPYVRVRCTSEEVTVSLKEYITMRLFDQSWSDIFGKGNEFIKFNDTQNKYWAKINEFAYQCLQEVPSEE